MFIVGSKATYSLASRKKEALTAAKELGYKKDVQEAIQNAKTFSEIDNILIDARHRWDIEYDMEAIM